MAITNLALFNAIVAFTQADDAWQGELSRTYSPKVINARYRADLNEATPALAALKAERMEVQRIYNDAWQAHIANQREIIASNDAGETAYEADRKARPLYHDRTPRPAWADCAGYVQWSWCRNPTPKLPDERGEAA